MLSDESTTPLSFFTKMITVLRRIILLLLPFFPANDDGNPFIGLYH